MNPVTKDSTSFGVVPFRDRGVVSTRKLTKTQYQNPSLMSLWQVSSSAERDWVYSYPFLTGSVRSLTKYSLFISVLMWENSRSNVFHSPFDVVRWCTGPRPMWVDYLPTRTHSGSHTVCHEGFGVAEGRDSCCECSTGNRSGRGERGRGRLCSTVNIRVPYVLSSCV